MRKLFWSIIPVIMLVFGCAGNAKPAENPTANSGLITLDQALNEAASRIDERIPVGSKIAPLNFNSPHDRFSNYVLEELTANLVDSRILTVVDRREINLIRDEFDFQFSGEVGDDSMQQIGRMLGAQSIISGNFTDMGGFIRIMIRVLNVQNASVEVQYRANIVSDTVTTALLTGGRTNVAVTTPRQNTSNESVSVAQVTQASPAPAITPVQQQVPQASVAPPTPTYRIGDTGPAGGLIFFDKGNNSGGWRYLEAAPVAYETTAQWRHNSGALGEDMPRIIGNTPREIGMGYTNTQNIMRHFNQHGGGFGLAIQVCNELVVNGFSDWFLPSLDELNFMYGNLNRRGLGGFRNEWYYSSTIVNNGFPARVNFANGEPSEGDSGTSRRVRAVRRF